MRIYTTLGISVLTLASFVGCDRRRDEPYVAPTPARESQSPREEVEREPISGRELATDEPSTNKKSAARINEKAVQDITMARCERETRCGNVGTDKKYSSHQSCMSEISKEWRDDLDFDDCAGGVVTKELNECLEEIKNEDCNNPFDKLSRLAACRESDLCKAVP